MLAKAVAIHGQKWDSVSKMVGTRSYHQVRQRYLRKSGQSTNSGGPSSSSKHHQSNVSSRSNSPSVLSTTSTPKQIIRNNPEDRYDDLPPQPSTTSNVHNRKEVFAG